MCHYGMLVHCPSRLGAAATFWLLKSRVVTECLQSGQLNLAKPFIILIV